MACSTCLILVLFLLICCCSLFSVVLELLSDIRDPLDVEEDEVTQQKRVELENRYQTMQNRLEELKKLKQGYINTENYEKAQQIKTVRNKTE
jgi:cell fate (sporulation/competence/biofilm development) regulator YmcA (YheA/YmcA/DUF963 family)